jgi:putative ABC transport system permease protein
MILRGMFRNKGRTIVGILAAALGSSLVVMAFGFVNSMTAMINFQFDKVLLSDYTIVLKDECDYGALLEVQNMPGISEAEPTFNVACTFRFGSHSKKGSITGLQPGAQMVVPCNKDGEVVDVPPSGLLMTRRLANELGVKAGEYIEFVSIKGERRPHRVKVVKLIENMLGLSVYANYDWLNRLMGESGAISEVQVRTAQTPAEKKAFLRGLKQLPKLESLGDVNRQKAMLTKQFNGAMLSMAFFMILFAGVIFFGSILNGSLISISERQREIATFRVLGYHPREVSEIMLRENMVMNMIGTVLGLPLGYGLLYNMMLQYQNDAYSMPAVVYTQTWVYTVALAILFVLGAQWVIHRNITKLQWQEALSMKE